MSAPGLYPHQLDLVARVDAAFEAGARAVVMQLGTGGGKTFTAAEWIRRRVEAGRRVLFLAHLDQLIEDTHARLIARGVPAGFVQAGRASDPTAPVQVGSLATLEARPNERPPADDVVIDECHRAMAPGVRSVLGAYANALLLGLTATPQRGDGQPLGDVFNTMESGPPNAWLTANGFLAPCDVIEPMGASTTELNGLACDPVDALARWAPSSRAIIFATNVLHAEDIARRMGDRARVLTGETPRHERHEIRRWIDEAPGRAIVNVAVCVEGFDAPAIDTVVLARSFNVCGSFLQAIGRGRRIHGQGKRCLVIDLKGSWVDHGLPDDPRRWSIDGKAVVRTGEGLIALKRCLECMAIFPVARGCPRCGATGKAISKLPRVLNRAEVEESVSHLPIEVRMRRYFERVKSRVLKSGKGVLVAEKIANNAVIRKFGKGAA